jgi:hypothetical protein
MVTIDWDNTQKAIEFTIKHYGTKTQGEDYRLSQVSGHIVEMLKDLIVAHEALLGLEVSSSIKISVK